MAFNAHIFTRLINTAQNRTENILIYIQQDATLHSLINWKLLYMFRVVLPPIIRSANNCLYSIWYLSHPCCYLPLSWKRWNWFECAVHNCLRSWWWGKVPPETCRAVSG